jgi:hypothetical protein
VARVAPTRDAIMVAQALSMGYTEFYVRRTLETKHGYSREKAHSLFQEGLDYYNSLHPLRGKCTPAPRILDRR